MRALLLTVPLLALTLAGCLSGEPEPPATGSEDSSVSDLVPATYATYTLPAVYKDPIGLYEPTIDVGGDGALYVSAHSTGVGEGPAPAYYSLDDGATWHSMALFADHQGEPSEQMSAPILSDELFIVAGADGTAWGMDCCSKFGTTARPVTGADPTGATGTALGVAGLVTPDAELPLVGWCGNGAEVCHYNQNSMDHASYAADAKPDCVPYYGTDRPWLAYANGKLLLVNNPGTSLSAIAGTGPSTGPIPLQVGALDVPPATPVAYGGAAWGIDWNLCGSTGGFIPGIPDMRDDHFFAVPQLIDFSGKECGEASHYDVITGNAANVDDLTQTTVFENSHVAPAEADSTPSNIGHYGQAVFDKNGALYVGAMNNTAIEKEGECMAHPTDGGIHLALSTDDAGTFTETTFRFPRPVSSFYMDGNRYGEGFLLNWGEIDGNHTDWFIAHVFANEDGTLRMENKMLAVDDGPEASRHVQGAAMGPDGRAYLVLSMNSQNPGGAKAKPGDTPMFVAVQQDGPTMPVS